jgi:hypothetical protein
MSDRKAAAAKIRDHVANKTPSPCNPTFMDGDGWWRQIREWPELGLLRSSVGPAGKASKVKPETYWRHRLMTDAYPTLNELLSAMEAGDD